MAEEESVPQEQLDLLKQQYEEKKIRLDSIIKDFNANVKPKVDLNRERRKLDIDADKLRQAKEIGEDETFIGIKTINQNIAREVPHLVNYLVNSRRLVVFKTPPGNPPLDKPIAERLEGDVTDLLQYEGWQTPFLQEFDGAITHGWSAIELVFDLSKPGHISFEYISADDFIFPLGTKVHNLNQMEILMRRYKVTPMVLENLVVEAGFDQKQVQLVLDEVKNRGKETLMDRPLEIFKVFEKKPEGIYTSWYSKHSNVTSWLRPPTLHFLGISSPQESVDPETGMLVQTEVDEPLHVYPIFVLVNQITELKELEEAWGRAEGDSDAQEALTCLWTSYVNGAVRASQVYGSAEQGTLSGNAPEATGAPIVPMRMYTEPTKFWSPPYPDESLIRAAQALEVQKSQEIGQIPFAVQNKKGSRTTAKELESAETQGALLNTVPLIVLSIHLRQIFTYAWQILQNRARRGLINLYAVEQIVAPGVPPVSQNNLEVISREFNIFPAGDFDIVRRAETLQTYKEFWAVVQQTPIAILFLADMLRHAFVYEGDRYANALLEAFQQQQQQNQAVQGMQQENTQLRVALGEIGNLLIDAQREGNSSPELGQALQGIKGLLKQ